MKQSQVDIVKAELLEKGYVSRNWCLKKYITRLGAIIHRLNKDEAMEIKGRFVPYEHGKDYVYYLPERHPEWNEDIISEDELTDMFGEGGKEEVKDAFLERCRVCQRFQCQDHKAQMSML